MGSDFHSCSLFRETYCPQRHQQKEQCSEHLIYVRFACNWVSDF